MRGPIRFPGMVALALVVSLPVFASADRVTFVPWKVLEPGAQPEKKAFVLFWIPASPEEMRRSDLITSERLALYASRCIGMHVVRVDDRPMLVKLGAAESLPMALLTEGDREISRLTTESGPLSALRVEAMVRAAFDLRENALGALLDRAGEKVSAGEKDAAIQLYREVATHDCAFPRLAKTAQRALRRLGVK